MILQGGVFFAVFLHYKGSAERLSEVQTKLHVDRKVDGKRKMK